MRLTSTTSLGIHYYANSTQTICSTFYQNRTLFTQQTNQPQGATGNTGATGQTGQTSNWSKRKQSQF